MSILLRLKDNPSNYREWASNIFGRLNRAQGAEKHMVKNLIKAASFYFESSFWEWKENNVPEMNVGTGP